ncbi:MAG: hypothetical protein ABI689_06190 [Thermoanaerobaculia bacterium]
MRVVTGRVRGGQIVMEGVELREGATVAVLSELDEAGALTLGEEDEAELLAAIAEIRSGRFVDGDELLADIRS